MGVRENFREILKVFRNNEELLRLLKYPPKNIAKNIKDPLDPTLPNILDIDQDWSIRDKLIIPKSKSDDLEGQAICRINVYAGERIPTSHNYQLANQDMIIDVFTHDSFEIDYRSLWISDKLNDLLVNNRVTGITKMKYGGGRKLDAPPTYTKYRHFYVFESVTK